MSDDRLVAAILVGGQSRRMGRDKAMLRLGPTGEPVLRRVVKAAGAVADEVVLIGPARPGYEDVGAGRIDDRWPGAGPLGGLGTALAETGAARLLLLACDLPFLSVRVLGRIVDELEGFGLVLPMAPNPAEPDRGVRAQPLVAAYSGALRPVVADLLEAGERRLSAVPPLVRTRYLDAATWTEVDPGGWSFLNLNRPADVELAHRLALEWGNGSPLPEPPGGDRGRLD